jgi:hypothetical protein
MLFDIGYNNNNDGFDIIIIIAVVSIYILLAVPGHALLWPFPVTD